MPSPVTGAAVDTHAHVFRQGLALADTRRHTPDYDATLAEYLALLDEHGLGHGVLVQPSFLGTDNSHLLQALRAASGRLRGVAVVAPGTAPETLQAMAEAGVTGIRLNLIGLPLPEIQAPEWQALLAAGCRVVVDHFGRPDPALGTSDPGFHFLLRQAESGRVWVKLSAPYRNWPASACAASGRLAARLLLEAYTPERLMWGSDWPHTEHRHLASYSAATQWLDAWIDDPAQRRVLLADTPLRLFQFQGDTP